ncbi:Peptidase M28 [hydrothermal vent metagenome]|uniref:Peptidase M28 n=1 Tax=hydrothermal vent metagenome TaxID=652676 RepID=A0A3B0VSU3_9ZZZZ
MKNIILLIIIALSLFACKHPDENSQKDNKTTTQYPVRVIDSISAESLIQHIKILSSDEFGGRAPASEGEVLTIEYIENEFRKAGLSPGNGNKYTQKVPLASIEVTNKPSLLVSKTRTDNANEAVMRLNYLNDQVVWTRQQVDAVSINNSELVFVGYGINAPERNWNDYAGIDVKGKTVVMLVNDPGYATQDEQLFNGNAMTYYGRWDYKFDEAGRQGASAAIIVHDTKPAAYGWSTVANSWTGPQFDTVHGNNQQSLVAVEGWITFENAQQLFKHANLSLDDMYAMAKTPGFQAVDMNLKASVAIENKQAFIESYNVMAMVEGTEKPNEVFIYMAHWDHLGTDLSLEGDGIYNGALDNATGIAGLIELAKVFAKSKPKRSVVFIAVTAEEQGLLGSAYYAANPVFPLNKTIAGINMDGLNNFGPTNDVTVIGLGMSEIDNFLKKAAADQGRILKPDAESEKGYFYRSDHFELSKLGVPMSYPNSGYDHFEKGVAYGIERSKEYLNNNYHRVSDEYDPSWDMTGAVQDLQLYYATGLEIINSLAWPQWYEGTEFKEIRDSQMRK